MVDIYDYDICCVEQEIFNKFYYTTKCDYTDYDCLLSLRKDMINERALTHQEEILPDIIAFNDALSNALREMYDRAHGMWDAIRENKCFGESTELTAKCFLSNEYPKLHPIQGGDEMQMLWSALCDSGWNKLYNDGVTLNTLCFPSDEKESFNALIGLEDTPQNWNEGFDRELTKDLHLTSAFYNLFEHTMFAITDFIYVRKFETEINIETHNSI